MRSSGWASIQSIWCPYKKKRLEHRYIREGDYEAWTRRQPSTGEGERCEETPAQPTRSQTLVTGTVRTSLSVVEAAGSVVLCYVSPRRLMNMWTRKGTLDTSELLPVGGWKGRIQNGITETIEAPCVSPSQNCALNWEAPLTQPS